MSSANGTGTKASDLAKRLEDYVLNLRQVEAALKLDPTHMELIKLRADLNELIGLTKKLLSESLSSNGSTKTGSGTAPPMNVTKSSWGHQGPSSSSSGVLAAVPGPSRSSMASSTAIQPAQAAMISSLKALGDDQYLNFMIQAFDESRPGDMLRNIVKYMTNHQRKVIRREKASGRYKPYQLDSDDENGAGQASHCNGSAGPATKTSSAGNAPLIYRGDMLSTDNDMLFLTVKQIRLKPTLYSDHRMVGAIVCLVNSQKQLAFWGIINWKREDICQTFPNTTGITIEKLEKGLPFQQILSLFLMAIDGKLLVGYKLEEDLQSLSVSHDRKEDIAEFFRDKDGPFALEDLNQALEIGKISDEIGNRIVHDTRALRGLHAWKENNQSIYPVFAESPNVGGLRKKREDAKPKMRNDPSEACRCKI